MDGEEFLTSRGVMMGEAIAKPSLTLLNLAVEELAYLEYSDQDHLLYTTGSANSLPWRCYHVGGDDHLAIGPNDYLRRITDNHLKSGSMISLDKHGTSALAVKYCERVLCLGNLVHNPRHRDHDKVIIVDTVKARLLSRGQTTLLAKDNKNVAIGKAQQLVKTLAWVPKETWPRWRIDLIRNLFIRRMHGLLPSLNKDPEAYYTVHLPKILGGYGLGLPDELVSHLEKAVPEVRQVVNLLTTGEDSSRARRLLSRLNQNISDRSIPMMDWYRSELSNQFRMYPDMVGAIVGSEMRKKFPAPTYAESKQLAKQGGWMDVEAFAKQVTRGTVFQRLLEKDSGPKQMFKTRPWIQEYQRIRRKLEDEVGHLPDQLETTDQDHLEKLLGGLTEDLFLDIRQVTSFDRGEGDDDFDFFDGELGRTYCAHRPNLRLGTQFIGINDVPKSFTRRVRRRHR
jgi:hypothetical protein